MINKININICELQATFKVINEARNNSLKKFPYSKMNYKFNEELKTILKNIFGKNIEFDENNIFGIVRGKYKETNFEIKTWNGLTLNVNENEKLIDLFAPIITKIIGIEPTCRYNYCKKNIVSIIEWSLNPDIRIQELISIAKITNNNIKNFIDFYNADIVYSLKDRVLTQEGFNAIFYNPWNNQQYQLYKISLLRALRPDIHSTIISKWIINCQTNRETQKSLNLNN